MQEEIDLVNMNFLPILTSAYLFCYTCWSCAACAWDPCAPLMGTLRVPFWQGPCAVPFPQRAESNVK